MKKNTPVRFLISLALLISLMLPMTALAVNDGKKHFKEGMKHEVSEQWDKAVESFALAVAENPKNPEYRLHLARSLFNASQMYMKKGSAAAKEKDYEAGYLAFRKAYAFDPTNELAKSEMERMVRLQKDVLDASGNGNGSNTNVKMVPTSLNQPAAATMPIPQKLEKLRDIPFPSGVDLQFIIKELAKDLDLNVLFDVESFRQSRRANIDLKNVTAARALDYIFLQEGLFFQKVGPRTIIVANQTQRQKFQQLVLRTFYLANAAPKDIVKVIQTAIPPQPGRSQTIVLTDDATNSVTVRDTEENVRLIGKLIASLDKDRAEVVMDVAIYEVNKSDLLQFGNQIGTQAQLTQLGGSSQGAVGIGDRLFNTIAGGATAVAAPTSIATGIILPAMNLNAFQSKNDTKLIASTQIHAFNNEQSSARIGQRVPVQSAQFVGLGNQGNVGGNNGVVSNVINYEQVGLTLKFKPLVFPNQDVQVEMEIESKDVAGASTLTPTFTERTIKGTARVQNNKTLLLASVAQGVETKGKQGLPILGLIPILGRLFTAPTRDNRQVDIVMAITPRVIRAPAILPEDEIERPTGSLGQPTSSNLEAMILEEERMEWEANIRRNQNTAVVTQGGPEFVRTQTAPAAAGAPAENKTTTTNTSAADAGRDGQVSAVPSGMPALRPIDSSVRTLQLNQTADRPAGDTSAEAAPIEVKAVETEPSAMPTVEIALGAELPELKAGEKARIPIVVRGAGKFQAAVVGLKFDEKLLAVRSVTFGDLFGPSANAEAMPFINQNGKMYVSLTAKDAVEISASGVLAYIEVEALASGRVQISFDRDVLNFTSAGRRTMAVRLEE